MNRAYPGKLLLFGEYVVIAGASALALPWPRYKAYYSRESSAQSIDFNPSAFTTFLASLTSVQVDLDAFKADLNSGLSIITDIPIGQGAGSSGAFTAAFFDRYGQDWHQIPHSELLKKLAAIESFFHGSSSGLDPLVSLLNEPITINRNGSVRTSVISRNLLDHFRIIQTNITRRTKPLVDIFKTKFEDEDASFRRVIQHALLPANESAVAALLSGNVTNLQQSIGRISQIQLDHFSEMIIPELRNAWISGIESKDYYIKLCGAGGGGFYLLYSDRVDEISVDLPFPILPI